VVVDEAGAEEVEVVVVDPSVEAGASSLTNGSLLIEPAASLEAEVTSFSRVLISSSLSLAALPSQARSAIAVVIVSTVLVKVSTEAVRVSTSFLVVSIFFSTSFF